MKLVFEEAGWTEYLELRATDPKALRKLNGLIEECKRHPFKGTGKPEPLKVGLTGYRSRRLSLAHRLVYRVTGSGDAQVLEIAQCRFHY